MKRNSLCIMLIALSIFGLGSSSNNSSPSYQWDKPWSLVWEDNFDGTALNTASWTALLRGENWNNEDQAYIAKNAAVENGFLVLTSKKESWEGWSHREDRNPDIWVSRAYTSAQVETTGKRFWTYGKFEVRAKPVNANGQGMLSAIWMVPEDKSWPPEIDIMEMLSHEPNKIYMTNHYGTPQNHLMRNGNHTEPDIDYGAGFHTFGIEWEPGVIRWFIDGVQSFESKDGVPNKPFRLIICPAIGPDWTGNPDAFLQFPNRFEVDWVRVYQRQ